jgi:predicted ATPase
MEAIMKRFLKLTVRGFRRLADVELDLRPLTVLIGANGVGKSSFLDAFSLLARSAQGGLLSAVGEMSGIGAMLTIGRADRIIFDISSNLANRETLGYALTLRPRGAGYVVEKETLRHHLCTFNPATASLFAPVGSITRLKHPCLRFRRLSESPRSFVKGSLP